MANERGASLFSPMTACGLSLPKRCACHSSCLGYPWVTCLALTRPRAICACLATLAAIVVGSSGIESQHVRAVTSAASSPAMREQCFDTDAGRLGIDWARTMAFGTTQLSDLVSAYEIDREQAAALSLGARAYHGHLGLHVWHDATPWCAAWLSDVLSTDLAQSANCAASFNASIASVEQATLAALNAQSRSVVSETEIAMLPVLLAAAANATFLTCTDSVAASANATAAGFAQADRAACIEAAAEAYGEAAAGRVQQRVEVLRARDSDSYDGGATLVDFTATYGGQVCATLPTPPDPERYSEVTQAVSVDLAYVLDGTVRAQVSPNKLDLVSPGVYQLSARPLEATRTQSAISDGVHAIVVDDVQLSAIVRTPGEALLRYRQIISVGQSCTAVQGHPCAYPTADFRTMNSDGSATGRTSSCQREASHGSKWYDTDANVASLKPSSPFQVLVDAYYVGTAPSGESIPVPSHLHAFRGLSVRAVHTACDVGEPGYCPQVQHCRWCPAHFALFHGSPLSSPY